MESIWILWPVWTHELESQYIEEGKTYGDQAAWAFWSLHLLFLFISVQALHWNELWQNGRGESRCWVSSALFGLLCYLWHSPAKCCPHAACALELDSRVKRRGATDDFPLIWSLGHGGELWAGNLGTRSQTSQTHCFVLGLLFTITPWAFTIKFLVLGVGHILLWGPYLN